MAYNPGVVDRSGEILGANILGAMQNLSSGFEQLRQRQQENKELEAQNRALETLIKPAASSAGLSPDIVSSLTASSADETPRARNARLSATLTGIQGQQRIQQEAQAQALQKLQLDAAQRDSAAAAVATAPTLPSPDAVKTAFVAGQPVPSAQAPDYSDAVFKYLNAGGKNPSTLGALNEMARTKMITSEREKAANLRAQAAESKLTNAQGNFDSIDKAASKALDLQKQGLQGVHVVTKANGTYDIEVKPPTAYAPDPAGKVQALIDQAQEELAAAQDAGDTAGAAAAQQKLANYQARMKKVSEPKTGGLYGLMGVVGAGASPVDSSMPGSPQPSTPPMPAPAVITPPTKPGLTPSAAAIQYLKTHPETALQFDFKYGKGAAAAALGVR